MTVDRVRSHGRAGRRARRRPIAGAALALALAGAAAWAGPSAPAFAHNSVVDQSPAPDATVTGQPGTVWLETSDALLDVEGAAVIDVIGPDGLHYATGCPSVEGPTASVPAELGPEGEYSVAWRVVSADGHPITGEFEFTWTPAEGESLAEGADEAACASAGESAGPGDAVSGPGDGNAEAAASGGVGDLLWVVGGAVAVGLAGLAAFMLTRRRPAPGGGAVGGTPGGDTTGRDTAGHEADEVDPDRPADR